jgi:hypothetical protein
MYAGLRVKCPLFVSDVNEISIFSHIFEKIIKFYENPCNGSGVVSCEQTDGRTENMTKLIIAFRNFANMPKNLEYGIEYNLFSNIGSVINTSS